MGKEGQPLQIDRKIRRVSGLTALAGAVTLTISGSGGIPQRQFESGEVVDKRYEEAREYAKTNFLERTFDSDSI